LRNKVRRPFIPAAKDRWVFWTQHDKKVASQVKFLLAEKEQIEEWLRSHKCPKVPENLFKIMEDDVKRIKELTEEMAIANA